MTSNRLDFGRPNLTIFVKLDGEILPKTSANRVLEGLGGVLGGSWGNLEASRALLEAFWASWGGFGNGFGASWRRPGSV